MRSGRAGFRLIGAILVLASCAAPTSLNLQQISGVYSYKFPNGDISGRKFTSENRLKIIPIDSTRALIDAELSFFNNHSCGINGIAEVRGQQLVYDSSKNGDERCEFSIAVSKGRIYLDDKNRICRQTLCGVRGGFDGESFATSSRRNLLKSEYLGGDLDDLDEVKEYKAAHPDARALGSHELTPSADPMKRKTKD